MAHPLQIVIQDHQSPPPPYSFASVPHLTWYNNGSVRSFTPAQVDGNHVVVDPKCDHSKQDGLPEDMQDILEQLDDLASWIRTTSGSSRHVTHPGLPGRHTRNLNYQFFHDKGKNRSLSTSLLSEHDIHPVLVDSSGTAVPGSLAKMSPTIDCQSEGFIYVPDCHTPEFLAGSSSSPIAYPVGGYSSLPSRHYPRLPDTTHNIPFHHRSLGRRSAPCPPPASPLISSPSGKASFKTLFQRSRSNTTTAVRPSIPSGHVPVENVLRQGKRMRLPWLRI